MKKSSTPLRGRIRFATLGAAALLVIGLSGCSASNVPKAYNTITEQNFLELCTNNYFNITGEVTDSSGEGPIDPALSQTSSTVKADISAPTAIQCVCQYNVFVNQVPINDDPQNVKSGYNGPNFSDLNGKLKTDPEGAWATVPTSVTDGLTKCMSAQPASSSTTSDTAAPSTTTTMN